MSNKVYVLYKHTNVVNGKSYIGWTSTTLEKRWQLHCQHANNFSSCLFHRAIMKYGVDAWIHDILEIHDTQELAKAAEIRLISTHQTFCTDHPDRGYNMTRGGDGLSGYQISPEIYLRVSQALTGNTHTLGRVRPQREKEQIAANQQILSRFDVERLQFLKQQGSSTQDLMTQFNCSYTTLRRALRGSYKALK